MENFLMDTFNLLLEESKKIKSNITEENDYSELIGFYKAMSIYVNQVDAFDLPLRHSKEFQKFKDEDVLRF